MVGRAPSPSPDSRILECGQTLEAVCVLSLRNHYSPSHHLPPLAAGPGYTTRPSSAGRYPRVE
jgi:hypothetical protein